VAQIESSLRTGARIFEKLIEQQGKVPTSAEVQQIIDEAKARRVALLEAPTAPMLLLPASQNS